MSRNLSNISRNLRIGYLAICLKLPTPPKNCRNPGAEFLQHFVLSIRQPVKIGIIASRTEITGNYLRR